MPIEHKKAYGIYHWDTFDNVTLLIDEADTIDEAVEKVCYKYDGQIHVDGADRVDIVDQNGKIEETYSVR